jgi:hypothetical protein
MNETFSIQPAKLTPSTVRYIKLGAGGRWAAQCLKEGFLRYEDMVPHEVAKARNWAAARQVYIQHKKAPGDALRELQAFYELDETCLWITFHNGRLRWAFAAPLVEPEGEGSRIRRTLAPWSCKSIQGLDLGVHNLSTRLTQVAGYRRTICSVAAQDELLRRLNGEEDALAKKAQAAMTALTDVAAELIADLHQADFETLVDLIFSRSGWRRVGAVGGSNQAGSDIILEQALTGERAFVQIKSRADQKAFLEYLEIYRQWPGVDRFFFVCHTPQGRLEASPGDDRVQIWKGPALAVQATKAGLIGWIFERRR